MRFACALLLQAATAAVATAQALTTDVPHRGAHVYSRTTTAFEVLPRLGALRADWVIRGGADGGHEWRHFACSRADAPGPFERPDFDDSAWPIGHGEFGGDPKSPTHRTTWTTDLLCLRTHVDLGTKKPKLVCFVVDHDDGLRVWLNGKPIVSDEGYGRSRLYVVGGAALDAWQRGDNVVAAACANVGGAQYFDLAMGVVSTLPPGLGSVEEVRSSLEAERDLASRVRGELFGAYRAPALLLQGELDPAGQRIRIPPADLRDLGFWLAMDLACGTAGGSLQLDAGRLFRLGDLQLRGKASPVDRDGWQTLEVTVKNTVEPSPRDDSKRFVDRYVRPHVWYGFDGRLAVRRRLTIRGDTARVEQFTVDLAGRLVRGKDWKEHVADLRLKEQCRWTATRDNQDAEFRKMVADALARGTAQLRKQLANPAAGDLAADGADATDSYHSGRLAIGLLALLKGGVPNDDETVQRCVAELRRRRLIDTYSLGNALMAIEALHAPAHEHADLRTGVIDRPRRRTLPPDDFALVQRWADQLRQNVDTRVDAAYLLRFNYTRGERFDNSVNQYALLGLYSAHLCGVQIPGGLWEAATNHLLWSQSPEGAKVDLDLVDYRTHAARAADPDAPFTTSRSVQRARGWSYEEPKDDGELTPTWGSMTCAGITGLAICQAAMQQDASAPRSKLQNDAERARRDGFAWLARHMTPRCHAGAIERQHRWFYYYLYSLERAALLSGVALIQDRDWYFEGAMVLVLAQQPNGDWPAELLWDLGIERNAMAILFLKQSTLPVLTGK